MRTKNVCRCQIFGPKFRIRTMFLKNQSFKTDSKGHICTTKVYNSFVIICTMGIMALIPMTFSRALDNDRIAYDTVR